MATAPAPQRQQPANNDAGSRRRILRIGVLLGGKIIEERLIREREDVTIGQSAKNTFSIALESLPRQWTLFSLAGDKYALQFTPGMDGRLSDGGQVYTLEALKGHTAQHRGDHWVMPLSEHSRGKITLGELTLLFQFVTEPPVQPRPMLPASVRGTFADRVDPQLAVILAISIVIHFGFAIAALLHDPEVGDSLAERAHKRTFTDEYTVETIETPVIPTEDPDATAVGKTEEKKPDAGGDKKPDKKPGGNAGDKKPAGGNQGGREENDAVALAEQAAAFADGLFSEDDTTSGLSGGMNQRKPGADLGSQMEAVKESGAQVAVGGGSGRGTRGSGEAVTGTGKGPVIKGPTGTVGAGQGKGEEPIPKGRISVSDKKTFDDTTLTPDQVLQKIMSAYMAGLKRCHKELLKKDPTARGKVSLAFTVNESGRAVSPNVKGFSDEVDACISKQVGNWRFTAPKDDGGDPTTADFQITLALQPE